MRYLPFGFLGSFVSLWKASSSFRHFVASSGLWVTVVELHQPLERRDHSFRERARELVFHCRRQLFHPLIALHEKRLGLGVLLLAQQGGAEQRLGVDVTQSSGCCFWRMARHSRRIGSASAYFFCWSRFDPSPASPRMPA